MTYQGVIFDFIGLGPPATRARLLAHEGVATVIESLADFRRETLLDHQ